MKTKFLKRIKNKDKLYLVLEENNKLQGFFLGITETPKQDSHTFAYRKIGYIGNVFIREKYRGKGYFSEFMKEFVKFLKKNKVKYCNLYVDVNNPGSIKAYKKWKFKPIEIKMLAEF